MNLDYVRSEGGFVDNCFFAGVSDPGPVWIRKKARCGNVQNEQSGQMKTPGYSTGGDSD